MKTAEEIVTLRRVVIDRFHPLNRVPTVTINMDARVEAAIALKDRLKTDPRSKSAKVTLNHIVLKATAGALRHHMFFNHDFDGRSRVYENSSIDIRSPVDFGDFPVHVVVPETDKKDLFEIAGAFAGRQDEMRRKVGELMTKYRDFRKNHPLRSAAFSAAVSIARSTMPYVPPLQKRWFDLQHRMMGTFMVTNMGTLGVIDCHGQLVRPSIGALLVLAIKDVVELDDVVPIVRRYLPLALEFDNRVTDAEAASAFLLEIKRNIEEPDRLI
ncbi:MAG: 2-oxo acid dehydrogenase subunit E2 [Myxococcota bacterium]